MAALSAIRFCPCFASQPLPLRHLLVKVARKMPAGTFVDGHMFGARIEVEVSLGGAHATLPITFGGWSANSIARHLTDILRTGVTR